MNAHPLVQAPPTTPLSYALAYAELGWHVHPLHWMRDGACSCGQAECKQAAKHPLTTHGLHDATTDPAQIRRWWLAHPHANIGVRTGRGSGLVAIDVDAGPGKVGDDTFAALVAKHGALPDTVEALTGGGGRHLLFAYPADVTSIASRQDVLGADVDVRADGGYIVVEPSSHRSGTAYVWEASSNPFDGAQPATLPAWMLGPLLTAAPAPLATAVGTLHADRVKEIRSALAVIDPDSRETWLKVGMALHSSGAGQQAYGLWKEWSEQSDKFEPADQLRNWRSFKARPDGIQLETIFAMAREHGWVPPATPGLILDSVRDLVSTLSQPRALAKVEPRELPAELLEPPGALGAITRFAIASSVRPVPIFAVQAAFALGSVVCARRYVSSQRNYSSLYLLNVAKSGTGKEEAKTIIERILGAAGFRKLLGGSSYASGGAVYSALLRKPQHLAIIDEFGKYMEVAGAAADSHRGQALTMLMETFGRCHGELSTPEFSTLALTTKQASEHEPKVIQRPSVSLLALTTPHSFYAALRSNAVLDGLLNRFVIVEHTGPRQPMQEWVDVPVPAGVSEWVQQLLLERGNLESLFRPTEIPDAVVVPFTESALRLSRSFEREMLTLADESESMGLGDMPIRTREIGMRMALIAALADTPDAPAITDDVLTWCFRYVAHFLEQTMVSLRLRLADSAAQRDQQAILAALTAAGEQGLTEREINRHRAFLTMRKHDRTDAIDGLIKGELVQWRQAVSGKKGRPRFALIALDPNLNEDRD